MLTESCGSKASGVQPTTLLTPELKSLLKSESPEQASAPLQTHLDAIIAVREHEVRCYFEAVLTRLRPREYEGGFTTDIRVESRENMQALQKLMKRSNEGY